MTKQSSKRSSAVTGLILALALVLLLFSTVGGAMAALSIRTDSSGHAFVADFATRHIGVQALCNGEVASGKGAMDSVISGTPAPGKNYDFELKAKNTGTIDEYVRLTIYKYWMKDGKKDTSLDPSLIHVNLDSSNWIQDDTYTDGERIVLYYKNPLAVGETTPDAATASVAVDAEILKVLELKEGSKTTYTYVYNGAEVGLTVEVAGVQTHNAKDAILSAWGVANSTSDDGPISLS